MEGHTCHPIRVSRHSRSRLDFVVFVWVRDMARVNADGTGSSESDADIQRDYCHARDQDCACSGSSVIERDWPTRKKREGESEKNAI